ncbi:hypothetical protein K461DRAFT_101314 [Myriangium duriaei CBS 260.36]|uniref:Rap-GAP domain-containing protein n=1 Tax=Myriangium duriaei CBS 260.36 TaxID=1168546 RepID=A0A9P4J973_9PEZI|nr:hypothetical protein K461DRAFT_101314 [Myriangium duriaei CBS 260.36]
MASARPPAATPERRRSQFFVSFGLTPRLSKNPSPSPASSFTPRRLVDASRRNERGDLSELLRSLQTDPITRSKALPILSNYVKSFHLDYSEIANIYQTLLELLQSDQDELVTFGFQLLHDLLENQYVPQSIRVNAISATIAYSEPTHLQQQPQSLLDATDDGKNIDGLEHDILDHICSVASLCFEQFVRASKDVSGSDQAKRSWRKAFLQCIRLLSNTVKFGPSIGDASYPQIIDEVRRMLEQLDSSDELLELLKVIDAFVTRGELPEQSLVPVIKTLCRLHASSSRQDDTRVLEKTNETLQWLCQTHAKSMLIDNLVAILHDAYENLAEDSSLATGSLQLLTDILSEPVLSKDVDIELDDVFIFLQRMQYDNNPHLLQSASAFLFVLVDKTYLLDRLTAEIDWDNLSNALLTVYLAEIAAGEQGTSLGRPELETAIRRLEAVDRVSPQQRYHLAQLGLRIGQHLPFDLPEKLLDNYERPLDPTEMHQELDLLCSNYIEHPSVSPQLQIMAADIVQKLTLGLQQSEAELARQCISTILRTLSSGHLDTTIQTRLVNIVTEYIATSADVDDEFFTSIVDRLSIAARSYSTPVEEASELQPPNKRKTARPITSALVLLFMRSINVSANRARLLMKTFMDLLTSGKIDPSASVMLLRSLFRLRGDINNKIFLVASPEGEGLAATLSRATHVQADNLRRPSKASSLGENGPVWKYGEIQGLPEDPPATASKVLSSIADPSDGGSLNMAAWLAYATSIVDKGADWEIYSYTIVHLGAQLTNQTLFTEAIPQLRELRALLCRQLLRQTVLKPPESTELKQSDVAACLYHVLTMLIGYHEHFSRSETEDMISAFIMGMTAWDRTTVPCVHALTLCCYELPESLKRDLVRIVSQMATIVTKSEATVHVLEFLAGLSRLTELARTFRGDEIKVVFGVCFSYIDYVRGKRLDESQQRAKTASVRSHDRPIDTRSATDDVGEYVFTLAYHVITFWFLSLQRSDREQYFPWMQQRLLSTDANGKREEQALVTVDLIWRVTRRIETEPSLIPPEPVIGPSTCLNDQYGLLTIERKDNSPTARIIDRRSSGTDEWTIPAPKDTPSESLLRTQLLSDTQNPFPDALPPIPIEATDASTRSIAMFDRTSPIDFFKAGVLYVGEDQSTESSILSNMMGSPDYLLLLSSLGSRLSLLSARHNTCGLDTSPALTDGPYTIWHRDAVTALILHIATLMPSDPLDDQHTRKKAHIGNDYVTVVFNNSSQQWQFDTLPSAFNYVHIVVSPEARSSFIETRTAARKDDWFERSWFKVQIVTRRDFPNLGSASEAKVVSGKALGLYVRNLVMNACIFAGVWAAREGGGDQGGSWRVRLGMLRNMRERWGLQSKAEEKDKGKGKK